MKLKELRLSTKKTQYDIAQHLNVDRTSYSGYEIGKFQPSIENLVKLADYFDVSLDYLCDRPYNNNVGFIPEDKKEAVKLFLQLNEQNAIKATGYISGLIANQ